MRGYMKEVKRKSQGAYAGTSEEGVGVIRLRQRISLQKIVSAAYSLGLTLSDERHPERRKYLNVLAKDGSLVATLIDCSLLLLPKHEKTKKIAIDFAEFLIQ